MPVVLVRTESLVHCTRFVMASRTQRTFVVAQVTVAWNVPSAAWPRGRNLGLIYGCLYGCMAV